MMIKHLHPELMTGSGVVAKTGKTGKMWACRLE
jgi:hypothetical protein